MSPFFMTLNHHIVGEKSKKKLSRIESPRKDSLRHCTRDEKYRASKKNGQTEYLQCLICSSKFLLTYFTVPQNKIKCCVTVYFL